MAEGLGGSAGLRDGAPVCRRYSEIAVGRALGRAAVGGRPARARCAGPGGRRRAAGAGGGRRRCSAETRSPSPRPRVPAQLSLASGTAHLRYASWGGVCTGIWPYPEVDLGGNWGTHRDRRDLGSDRIGRRATRMVVVVGLLVSEVEPGPCASAQDRVGRVACTARFWGHPEPTTTWGCPAPTTI